MTLLLASLIQYAGPAWIFNMATNCMEPLRRFSPWIARYNFTLDRGIVLRDGNRLLGDSVGLFVLIPSSILAVVLSFIFQTPVWLMFLVMACVFVGDALGSFVKRRFGFKRGEFMPIADHGDYMIVTGIVFWATGLVPFGLVVLALGVTYFVHPCICYLGYKLHIKTEPF